MGSVTHNLDMDQRFLKLNTTAITGGVRVDAPANANVAPPGWYMAFLVDPNGVPSVSQHRPGQARPDTEAPSTVTGLTASRTADDVTLNWNAATDNIGVTGYRVHRGTTSTLQPDGRQSHRDRHQRPHLHRPGPRHRHLLLQGGGGGRGRERGRRVGGGERHGARHDGTDGGRVGAGGGSDRRELGDAERHRQ